MSKRKQVTIEDMKKAMAIEFLPVSKLKKRAEVQVDFSNLIQKVLKYNVKLKNKGEK